MKIIRIGLLTVTLPLATALAQGPRGVIGEMAQSWSGLRLHPHCQSSGPRGEYLGVAGSRYCEWPARAGSAGRERLSVSFNELGGPALLTWERKMFDVADARRLSDSLGAALVKRGLVMRNCPGGDVPAGKASGSVWEGGNLLVMLNRIDPAAGAPTISVMATDAPAAFPTVLCPKNPDEVAPPSRGSVLVRPGTTRHPD
jgi:hypothetical protein